MEAQPDWAEGLRRGTGRGIKCSLLLARGAQDGKQQERSGRCAKKGAIGRRHMCKGILLSAKGVYDGKRQQ